MLAALARQRANWLASQVASVLLVLFTLSGRTKRAYERRIGLIVTAYPVGHEWGSLDERY